MTGRQAPQLAERAAHTHVVVVGGGVSGLVAARECAKVGMRVTVVEASDQLGGAIRRAEIDGVTVDAGAESYATRGGHVRALVTELGLADRIEAPAAGGAWLDGIPDQSAAPLPKGGILGIPGNPFQDDVRRIIGWRGAWRAYVDRVRPPLTIGHERSLGTLVRSRMGQRVLDRLVAPVTGGVYSAHPDDVDVDVAAPGLNAALTRVGSLSGAVAAQLAERAAARADKTPGAAVEGLAGGMSTLIDALRADIEMLGAEVRTGRAVLGLERDGRGWTAVIEPGADEGDPAGPGIPGDTDDRSDQREAGDRTEPADRAEDADEQPAAAPERLAPDRAEDADDQPAAAPERLAADAVILAVTEDVAHRLLGPHVPQLSVAGEAPQIEIVTLLLDAPDLDAAPRGTGVLTVPGSRTAKALTHATAKWSWLRERAGGRHVVRVSFGSQGEAPATAGLDDDAAAALALTEASTMLGVELRAEQLIGAHRSRFPQSQPASLLGAAERRAQARDAVRALPGLSVVGAWLAGTGLAQVVPDAVAEADRLRRRLLWTGEASSVKAPND